MDVHSTKIVEEAFKNDLDLQRRVVDASKHFQNGIPELLRDIAIFILSLPQSGQADSASTEPTAKKRKLEQSSQVPDRSIATENGNDETLGPEHVLFECKDVSFTSPLRKKLKLQFVVNPSNPRTRQIRLLNQATDAVEYALRAENTDAVFCLPVPEKAQRQQCFVVFPLPGTQTVDGSPAEPLVWTMNETKAPPEIIKGTLYRNDDDTFVDMTRSELNVFMASFHKKTVLPDEREFASEIPQSHRKGEKAFHTKAFKGSKEGYLYLLSTGIVFGFKKPVAFFPFNAIESISFTSVLQRTFNIVITTSDAADPEKRTEHELSMVDQADFQPINAYINAHGLNDASMAAERRAKVHNVNKPAAGESGENGEAADGRGEIEKAEELLQDQEDEEEEDYDPSGGESEGSGEDSDDEDGEGEGYEDGEGEEEEWDEDEEVGAEEGAA